MVRLIVAAAIRADLHTAIAMRPNRRSKAHICTVVVTGALSINGMPRHQADLYLYIWSLE